MEVIITGGAGFIGSALAKEFSKKHEVIVIDDLSTGRIENVEDGDIKFVTGSVTKLDLLRQIFNDADYVFHQAAIPSVPRSIEDPIRTNEVNVTGTLNVLIASWDGGVKKVIYASSSSVYGDTLELPKREDMRPEPKSPYAVTKLMGEYYCKVFNEVYHLKTVSLRYFNVYGPKQDPFSEYAAVIPRFIKRVQEGKPPIIYGDGKQTRDFTYVLDVVRANMLAMESNATGVFNIASGKRISINKLANKITEIIGIGMNLSPIHEKPRAGDIKHSWADVSLAREKLGYEPKYSIDEGLEEVIKWFKRR
jgi:UDP-glucose 4-epimerase